MSQVSLKSRIGVFVFYLLVSPFLLGIVAAIFNIDIQAMSPKEMMIVNLVSGFINIIGLTLIASKKIRYDYHQSPAFSDFIKTALKWAGLAIVAMMIAGMIVDLFVDKSTSDNQAIIDSIFQLYPFQISIMTIIIAPIVEELVFRYAIIDVENKNFTMISLIISSLLFGLIHLNLDIHALDFTELWYLLIYGTLGFVLGLSYVKSKNILMPIAVHALYNAFVTLIMFIR